MIYIFSIMDIMDFLNSAWVEAIHVIAVICWMAGMLYLPRLFVYHSKADKGSEMDLTFQTMERKLLRIIINPSMVITIIFGTIMLIQQDLLHSGEKWIHIKLMLVIILTVIHGFLAKERKKFIKGNNKRSAKFYVILNESIAVIMALIVIMVIVRPF